MYKDLSLIPSTEKKKKKESWFLMGMVTHIYNPSIWETEAGEF
jgi:hypothetical protein